jgi:hypothetical protein
LSLPLLALVVGILGGFMLSLVLVSLLNMAKLGDAYLEVLEKVAEEKLRFKNIPEMLDKENAEVSDAQELSL